MLLLPYLLKLILKFFYSFFELCNSICDIGFRPCLNLIGDLGNIKFDPCDFFIELFYFSTELFGDEVTILFDILVIDFSCNFIQDSITMFLTVIFGK